MAMTLRSRRELYKLRELIDFLLQGPGGTRLHKTTKAPLCYFCEHSLVESDFAKHGESVGPKMDVQITVHHVNHDHDDQRHSNKALCHTRCHRSYHRSKANAVLQAMRAAEK